MSEYGEIETGQEHAGLQQAHEAYGAEQDHQAQYGILEQDHHSYEHEEFEHLKHIEYTDAAGNHYEVTEYTHYEHTEVEDDHTFMAYGQESGGSAGLHQADAYSLEGDSAGVSGLGEAHFGAADGGEAHFGAASVASGLESITSRFENFLGSGFLNDNEINDASA
ncbi:hypothetical protein [Dactylosporangium sp. CA-139066]|uniref:hypothetical protein n=1 Tax=Dactylosporangium sp. CA-139066 TaxID=3239930 RepID=UPI003D8B75C3